MQVSFSKFTLTQLQPSTTSQLKFGNDNSLKVDKELEDLLKMAEEMDRFDETPEGKKRLNELAKMTPADINNTIKGFMKDLLNDKEFIRMAENMEKRYQSGQMSGLEKDMYESMKKQTEDLESRYQSGQISPDEKQMYEIMKEAEKELQNKE